MANPTEHFENMFLQLAFALKLSEYIREGNIDLEKFNEALHEVDSENRVALPNLNTSYDLILAAENNINICFGAAANCMWEAYRFKTGRESKDLRPQKNEVDKLPSLIYMLRCCFAHNPAKPKWQIVEKYRTNYSVEGQAIDLTERDGTHFSHDHLGSAAMLWVIKKKFEAKYLEPLDGSRQSEL